MAAHGQHPFAHATEPVRLTDIVTLTSLKCGAAEVYAILDVLAPAAIGRHAIALSVSGSRGVFDWVAPLPESDLDGRLGFVDGSPVAPSRQSHPAGRVLGIPDGPTGTVRWSLEVAGEGNPRSARRLVRIRWPQGRPTAAALRLTILFPGDRSVVRDLRLCPPEAAGTVTGAATQGGVASAAQPAHTDPPLRISLDGRVFRINCTAGSVPNIRTETGSVPERQIIARLLMACEAVATIRAWPGANGAPARLGQLVGRRLQRTFDLAVDVGGATLPAVAGMLDDTQDQKAALAARAAGELAAVALRHGVEHAGLWAGQILISAGGATLATAEAGRSILLKQVNQGRAPDIREIEIVRRNISLSNTFLQAGLFLVRDMVRRPALQTDADAQTVARAFSDVGAPGLHPLLAELGGQMFGQSRQILTDVKRLAEIAVRFDRTEFHPSRQDHFLTLADRAVSRSR